MNQNQIVIAEEVIGRARTANINAKRMVICLMLRQQGLTLCEIGRKVHRDHATVHHLINRALDLLSIKDPLIMETHKSFQQTKPIINN